MENAFKKDSYFRLNVSYLAAWASPLPKCMAYKTPKLFLVGKNLSREFRKNLKRNTKVKISSLRLIEELQKQAT
jgi:hypothetical protein